MSSITPRLPARAASCCRSAVRSQQLRRPSALRTLTTTTQSTTRSSRHPLPAPLLSPRRPSPISRRLYHSYDHPSPPTPFSPTERAILTAAYAHVPHHGFSNEALALGARDAGYLDISTNLLSDGVFSLVQWHLVAQHEALAARAEELFSKQDGKPMGVGEKVEALVWARLMGNEAIINKWQEVCCGRLPRATWYNC